MRYPSLAWGIVGLCALLAGCAVCAHPYDYMGPVIPDAPGEGTMGFCDREGSILSGTQDAGPYEQGASAYEVGGYDTGAYEGAMNNSSTLAPAIEPQSVASTSRRVTREVAR
jgi:hypothetical protein